MAEKLREEFTGSSVEVVEGDVLKVSLPPFDRVIGTPPYYISSKLVLLLLKSKFRKAHLVFQKEFGERLLAHPGSSDYGRLSVSSQRILRIEALMDIPRGAFEPKPKIDSMLLALEPKAYRHDVNGQLFDELVRGIFTQRRRLLRGALIHFFKLRLGPEKAREILKTLKIPDNRVYELSVDQLEEITKQLEQAPMALEASKSNNILRRKPLSGSGSQHADN